MATAVSAPTGQYDQHVSDLRESAISGEYYEVEAFLNSGIDVNARLFEKDGTESLPALQECIKHSTDRYRTVSHRQILALFIQRGVDVNAQRCGEYPLHIAATLPTDEVAGVLLRAGADPRYKNSQGKTPMDIAKKLEHEPTKRLLIIWAQQLTINELWARIDELEQELRNNSVAFP